MKILHIIDSGGLYGAEMVLLNLVAEQIKLGLHPTIAGIGEKHISEKPLETEALKRGFKVKKIRMFPGPNLAGALEVLRYAHSNGFDLLHSHGYKGNVAFGFMPGKFRRIPLVSTAHGWTSTKGLTKNRIYEWLDTLSFKFIDAVILVSNAMKYHPRLKSLNGNNIHVIPNGIPIPDNHAPSQLPNFSSSKGFDKKIIDFCQNAYTIGSIGRLSTEKGYKYLIEALSLLVKKGIDACLVIIGEGYERGLLEELVAQLGLKDRILLPGYRDNAQYYIPFFKVFLISSLTEGLPITLLEAMQAKVSIVATKVGGIPEVLHNGQGGLLVEPCNSKSLAEAILLIHNNSKLVKKLTSAAYAKATSDYSSEKMALQYLNIYRKVLKNNQRN